MSLPTKAIDRLFERMAATYGGQWSRQWADVPMPDVKTAWAHELSGYANRLEVLAWALENLPERCPNVIEFRNLCRRAPAPEAPRLPEPKADPERLKQELAKLGEVRAKAVATSTVDHKAWAKRIVARCTAGDRINPTSLRMAQQALRKQKSDEGEA
jgi:hypothetical protein